MRCIVSLYFFIICIATHALSTDYIETKRYFYDNLPILLNDTVIQLRQAEQQEELYGFTVEIRGTLRRGKSWGITVGDYCFKMTFDRNRHFDIDRGVAPVLSVSKNDSIISTFRCETDKWSNGDKDANTLIINTKHDGSVNIEGGYSQPRNVASIKLADMTRNISVFTDGVLEISTAVIEDLTDRSTLLKTEWTTETLTSRLSESKDLLEGFYNYLDGDNDPMRAIKGGRYRLALVSDGSGGYNLIYAGGASVAADKWEYGMLKATIKPTIFINHYDVVWYDATFRPILRDVSLTIEQGALLTFNFPHYKTVLRFSKEQQ